MGLGGCPWRAAMAIAALAILGFLMGCERRGGQPSSGPAGSAAVEPARAPGLAQPAKIELTSPALEPQSPIPARYTEDGEDLSPPLAWSAVPEGTRELALICDDPDAPSPAKPAREPWVHWVLYKIPPHVKALPEGIPRTATLDDPPGAVQGKNSWPTLGYRGPAPPPGSGKHRYVFKLYALDTELPMEGGADKAALLAEMSGHVIGQGELTVTYER